jgi:hypothetical protein
MTVQNIEHEFDAAAPLVAQQYTDYVTRTLTRLRAKYDRAELRQLAHAWGQDGATYRALRCFLAVDESACAELGLDSRRNLNCPQMVDVPFLEKTSKEYAAAQIASFKAKLRRKLIDLTDVSMIEINGSTFRFKGMLKGHKVLVEQTCELSVSNRGTPFHRWPARIYLDGKFISEANLRKSELRRGFGPSTFGKGPTMHRLELPIEFYDDHAERGSPSGEVVERGKRMVTILCDDATLDKIERDAEYCSSPHCPDLISDSLRNSAKDCLRRIRAYKVSQPW